jgi:hypothetical protein
MVHSTTFSRVRHTANRAALVAFACILPLVGCKPREPQGPSAWSVQERTAYLESFSQRVTSVWFSSVTYDAYQLDTSVRIRPDNISKKVPLSVGPGAFEQDKDYLELNLTYGGKLACASYFGIKNSNGRYEHVPRLLAANAQVTLLILETVAGQTTISLYQTINPLATGLPEFEHKFCASYESLSTFNISSETPIETSAKKPLTKDQRLAQVEELLQKIDRENRVLSVRIQTLEDAKPLYDALVQTGICQASSSE